jgi:hypothetical protein
LPTLRQEARIIEKSWEGYHPSRFANRVGPKVDAPLGDPPEWMTETQVTAWDQFKHELGWLNASHAAIVEIASIVRARVRCGEEVGVSSLNLLRQCLGSLGATPADASKVALRDEEEVDPSDRYFS